MKTIVIPVDWLKRLFEIIKELPSDNKTAYLKGYIKSMKDEIKDDKS